MNASEIIGAILGCITVITLLVFLAIAFYFLFEREKERYNIMNERDKAMTKYFKLFTDEVNTEDK